MSLIMPEDKDEQRRQGEMRRRAREAAEDAMIAVGITGPDIPLLGSAEPIAIVGAEAAKVMSQSDGLGFLDYDVDADDGSREWATQRAIEEANAELPIGDHVVAVTLLTNIWKIDQLVAAMNHTFDHDCQWGQMILNELSVMIVSQLEERGNQLVIDWRSGEAAGED